MKESNLLLMLKKCRKIQMIKKFTIKIVLKWLRNRVKTLKNRKVKE